MYDPGAPTRIEHDSLGPVDVPADRLWGAQTERSRRNFRISDERMPLPVVHALVLVKKTVALTHAELGMLPAGIGEAVAAAADEVLAGRHDEEFPLSVWQTGSGTQTNMNVNEVLANRASELLGGRRGEGRLVHPNDHVNRGHSSNDVFPTAMSIACSLALEQRVVPAVSALRAALSRKAEDFRAVTKIGRTHLMDATPLTLGQELGGWAAQLDQAVRHLVDCLPHLGELALGGSAVGTGLNAHAEVTARVVRRLREITGLRLTSAPNKFEALASHDAVVFAHGGLKTLAAALHKIASDVRLLASGPRSGIGELRIPENEPGSSIMPGKVNPTQCEAVVMLAAQVVGNDVAIAWGGAGGQLQLNANKPLIVHAFLQSARLLADGADGFREHCIAGLEPDRPAIRRHLDASLMLVTALVPHVGYDRAAEIARKAHLEGTTLRESALALGVDPADFDSWANPDRLVTPG